MSRVIAAFAQFFDGDGEPLSNGWLKFLVSGTNNTFKTTFSDSDLSFPNENPIQLDGEGRCPNVFGTGSYKVISYYNNPVTNLPGAQLQEFDPVVADYSEGTGAGGNFAEWDINTTYQPGYIVIYNARYYRSITANNIGNIPDVILSEWEEITFLRYYNANVNYQLNDVVIDSAVIYFSLQNNNMGNTPSISPTWWAAVGGGAVITNWEENVYIFRPIVSMDGQLGDSTHLIEYIYLGDSGTAYFGADQDLEIYHDGTDSFFIDNTGDINLNPTGVLNYNGNEVLTVASTIDADTLDGLDSTQFLRSDITDYTTGDLGIGISPVLEASNNGLHIHASIASEIHMTDEGGSTVTNGCFIKYNNYILSFDIKETSPWFGFYDNGTEILKIESGQIDISSGNLRLDNNYQISLKDSGAINRNLAYITVSDFIWLGDSAVPINIYSSGTVSVIAGDLVLDNNKVYKQKDTGGTTRTSIQLYTDDQFYFGDSNIKTNIKSNGTVDILSSDLILNNNYFLQGEDTTNNARNLAGIDSSNITQLGNTVLPTNIQSNGTLTHNTVDLITDLLPAQATHSGEFLQTDGAGTLSWAAAGGTTLLTWEENGNDFRPITTKVSDLGDSTHLIVHGYFSDGGHIYLGDSQDMFIQYTGAAGEMYSTAGSLTLGSYNNIVRLVANNSFIWDVLTDGTLRPLTTSAYDIGDSTHLIKDQYFCDSGTIYFGDSQDASIAFDGADLAITGSGSLLYNTNEVLTTASTIDADTLDSLDSTQFLRSDTADSMSAQLTFTAAPLLNNSIYLNCNETPAAGRPVLGINASNEFQIGNTNNLTNIRSNGTLTHNTVDLITDLLPAQATHSGEFLQTDGAGTLSWAAVSGLSTWENSGNILRPITTGAGQLGDATHLIDDAYFQDNGYIYLGSGQDMHVRHDGTDGYITNGTGYLRIATTDILLDNNKFIRGYETGATPRAMLAMDSSNYIRLGNGSNRTNILSNGDVYFQTSNIHLDDGYYLYLGTDSDLRIRHSGAVGTIYNYTGSLSIGTYAAQSLRFVTNSTFMWDILSDGTLKPASTNTNPDLGTSAQPVDLFYSTGVYNNAVTGRDVYVSSAGLVGYLSSASKVKENIKKIDDTSWIYDLEPKRFNYIADPDKKVEYGLIAEDVEEVHPQLCFYDIDEEGKEEIAGVNYRCLHAVLINEIQKLREEINELKVK